MPENRNIQVRSDDVQEIMSHVPHWMIRYGISVMFLLIALLIFIAWFIKYPDTIQGTLTVSTQSPPTRLVSKSSGELSALMIQDGEDVKKGDVIATINHSFSIEAREYLSAICSEIKDQLNGAKPSIQFDDEHIDFGSSYRSYKELKSSFLEFQNFLENDPIQFEISSIAEQINNYSTLRSVSKQQLVIAEKELKNAREEFKIDQQLYSKNIISKVQLFEKEQKLIQSKTNVGNVRKSAVENSITITDLKRELNQLKQANTLKRNEFIKRINIGITDIQNALDLWKQKYQIVAPMDGKLTYLKTIHEHEYVSSETPLFAILDENQDFIGYIDVPKSGFGKLEVGQKVRARIDKYPHQEFGQLSGTVTEISPLANKEAYRIQFVFNDGMKSSYGKHFEYSPEMTGTADVITSDIRLLSRIFNKFRKVFD